MITQEQKDAWIAALRSGEYSQTQRTLHRVVAGTIAGADPVFPAGYCCLGVLANIIDPTAWDANQTCWVYPDGGKPILWDAELPNSILPQVTQHHLIDLNDSDGKSFTEIADYIEANLNIP